MRPTYPSAKLKNHENFIEQSFACFGEIKYPRNIRRIRYTVTVSNIMLVIYVHIPSQQLPQAIIVVTLTVDLGLCLGEDLPHPSGEQNDH